MGRSAPCGCAATVTVKTARPPREYQAVSNDKGMYALIQLPSGAAFTLQAEKSGFAFTPQTIQTGTSRDWQASTGNQWGINFVGTVEATPPLARP